MVFGLLVLLLFQLAGECVVHFFDLIIPGPVLGMIFLLSAFMIKNGIHADVQATANNLIKHIALLFVPAGVGVVLYLDLIIEEWAVILLASMGSTVLTLALVFAVFATLSRQRKSK